MGIVARSWADGALQVAAGVGDAGDRIVGRERELAVVDSAIDLVAEGQSVCVALVGEPGIGKTFVLREACRRGEQRGLAVVEGWGTEFEREVPFGLAVDALDGVLARQSPAWLERLGHERLAELASVFPALAGRAGALSTRLPAERYRCYEAVRAVVERLAAERPLMLALDDVHWADEASVEMLAHILRHRPAAPILALLAYRSQQAPSRLVQAVADVARDGATVLELGRLTEAEADELLGSEVNAGTLREIYRDSGGNPLYLTELARAAHAADEPAPVVTGMELAEDESVPSVVCGALVHEVEGASAPARALLRAAAVAGEPFELELAARIAAMPDPEALDALDELLRLGLLRATSVPRRYVFRHPIVRRALYVSAGVGFRLNAHARAAQALAEAGAPLNARAHHVERSASPGDREAARLLATAAEEAASRAPSTAARWYSAALRLLPENSRLEDRLALMIPLATALGATGNVCDGRAVLMDAVSMLAPDQGVLRARLVGMIARFAHMVGAHGAARDLLADAVATVGDERSVGSVTLKIELAIDRLYPAEWSETVTLAAEARDEADALGDRLLQATARAVLGVGHYNLGQTASARAAVDQAANIFDELSDLEVAARLDALATLGFAEFGLGRSADSVRHLERGLAICRASGQGCWFVVLTCLLCNARLWLGRLEEAAASANAALEATVLGQHQPRVWALSLGCWVSTARGDLNAAIRAGEEAAAVAQRFPASLYSWLGQACLGMALIEAGQPELGREHILAAVGGPDLDAVNHSGRPRWYDILTQAELAVGDLDAAERWVERAEATAAPLGLVGRQGLASRARAALALARGDARSCVELAGSAATAFAGIGLRIDAARSWILEARGLAGLGRRDLAIERLERAYVDLADCGAERYRDEAARELRRLGRRVARRGRPRVAATGVESLTPREREVAELVAEGMKNREVAAQLFLSRRTVEKHLARIFEKLNLSSRGGLARAVERARLDEESAAL